ncbi:putative ABC transporter, permease [Nocardia nova SH22a]|uniref:Putative ABC transporter, permease n=1 Tax=Nocardia nova SH22a TaxID=1415166 RepID=W5TFC4_9NOCA|nr:ABC transporter permease [Nocardia nova]AHH17902.1 putative ABC transporter, permease [Nocardia nova SH22a]
MSTAVIGKWITLDIQRVFRNGRFFLFSLALPVLFFVVFGLRGDLTTYSYPGGNATAYVMVSMALYASAMAATSAAAQISAERWQGWVRQMQALPPSLPSYVLVRVVVASVQAAMSVLPVFVLGALLGARVAGIGWVLCPLICWLSSIMFSAFGVFVGFTLRSQNAMQIVGPGLTLVAALGSLFVPIDSGPIAVFGQLTPMWGIGVLARQPIVHSDQVLLALVNVAFWAVAVLAASLWAVRRPAGRALR